jgi:hypothetical protein
MLEVVLAAVPLLLLLASLLVGFYPGCEAALRLSERIAAAGRRRLAPASAAPPRRPRRSTVRGGQSIGFSLSGRAPPAAA